MHSRFPVGFTGANYGDEQEFVPEMVHVGANKWAVADAFWKCKDGDLSQMEMGYTKGRRRRRNLDERKREANLLSSLFLVSLQVVLVHAFTAASKTST